MNGKKKFLVPGWRFDPKRPYLGRWAENFLDPMESLR